VYKKIAEAHKSDVHHLFGDPCDREVE